MKLYCSLLNFAYRTQSYQQKVIKTKNFLHNMIRQSEIANFLDLIKHITEARDFKGTFNSHKRKKKCRYNQSQLESDGETNEKKNLRKSVNQNQINKNSSSLSQFEHKMLKITHEIKRKPKSFKIDHMPDQNSHSLTQSQFGEKINKIRSNMYENYCEMIQKKRQEKISKLFRNSDHDASNQIYNISETINFQSSNEKNIKQRQTPFIKSKTLKPGIESIKAKVLSQKIQQKSPQKVSRRKMQPQQLNIESMRGVKMPKLPNNSYNQNSQNNPSLSNKRVQIKFLKNLERKPRNPINKPNNLDGWVLQDEDPACFNIDYF